MASANPLLGLFAKSPLSPIQQHMDVVYQCTELLTDFFNESQNQSWDKADSLYQQICALESEADNIKRDIRINLPNSLFLAITRTDLLDLLSKQDRIANRAQDIAGLALGREMVLPDPLVQLFNDYLGKSIEAAQQANKAIHELDELLATGFRGNEVDLVEKMITNLSRIESQSDEVQIKLRKQLFNLENQLQAVEVMFIYKIIDWVGDLADRAQSVGSRLELIMAS